MGAYWGQYEEVFVFSYNEGLMSQSAEREFNLSDPFSGQIILIDGFNEKSLDVLVGAIVQVGQGGYAAKSKRGISPLKQL